MTWYQWVALYLLCGILNARYFYKKLTDDDEELVEGRTDGSIAIFIVICTIFWPILFSAIAISVGHRILSWRSNK